MNIHLEGKKTKIVFVGTILFTKSAIGLGLLSNAYFFTQTGIILGSLTSICLCFLISYSMGVLLKIADEYESKHNNEKLENLDMVAFLTYGKKL